MENRWNFEVRCWNTRRAFEWLVRSSRECFSLRHGGWFARSLQVVGWSFLSVLILGSVARADVSISLSDAPIPTVVDVLLRDAIRGPFTIAPAVSGMTGRASVEFVAPDGEARERGISYLQSLGVYVIDQGTFFLVTDQVPVPDAPASDLEAALGQLEDSSPFSSPDLHEQPPEIPVEPLLVVRAFPVSADPSSVVQLVSGLSLGTAVPAPGGERAIIWRGEEKDAGQVRDLLAGVKTREFEIRAAVFQYDATDAVGSAVTAALAVASSGLGGGVDVTTALDGGITISAGAGGVEALVSALDRDTRFRSVVRPVVRATVGTPALFNASTQIPTIASTTVVDGAAVQSIDYRSAGLTFSVNLLSTDPTGVSLDLAASLSSVVSGSSTQPTGTTAIAERSVNTRLKVASSEIALVGGLLQVEETKGRRGIFGIPLERANDQRRLEYLLLLSVREVDAATSRASSWAESGISAGHGSKVVDAMVRVPPPGVISSQARAVIAAGKHGGLF